MRALPRARGERSFPATDFNDPLHLRERRGEVLGALVLQRVVAILGSE